MAETTKRIETVEAKEGKNPGEVVATIGRYSICFLPRGVKNGERVRVELIQLDKTDSRGRPMYRSVPAPTEAAVEWRMRHGMFENVEYSIDWKLQKKETRVLESRAPKCRDGEPRRTSTFTVDWGTSLDTARVKVSTKTEIPQFEERLGSNGPEEFHKSSRDAGTTVEEFTLDSFEPICSGYVETNDWLHNQLRAVYSGEPRLYIRLKLTYAGETAETNSQEWSSLPSWLKVELEAAHPLCGCGESRVDAVSGAICCPQCALLEQYLPSEKRQEIAALAERLLAAECLPREAGEIVLKSTIEHIESEWRRGRLVEEWSGYAWYYFAADGVYGSKFPRSALQALQYLELVAGEGLQELAAWLCGRNKAEHCEYHGDYFMATQIKGQTQARNLNESGLQSAKLAVRLRGSEADRVAALDACIKAASVWGNGSERVREIESILQDDAQDYALALAKAQDSLGLYEARERAAKSGEIWPDVTVSWSESGNGRAQGKGWAIAPSGQLYPSRDSRSFGDLPTDTLVVSHSTSNYAYRYTECWTIHKLPRQVTAEQRARLASLLAEERRYFAGKFASWDLTREGTVTVATAYSRDFSDADAEAHRGMTSQMPIDLSRWFVRETNRDERGNEVERIFEVWHRDVGTPEEEERRDAERQVAEGQLLSLRFRKGIDRKSGQPQWEAGDKQNKFVLDRYSPVIPVERLEYFCSPGRVVADTGTYRVQLVTIVPPLPISSALPADEIPAKKHNPPGTAAPLDTNMLTGLFGGVAKVNKTRRA